jgi:hypothetical protein
MKLKIKVGADAPIAVFLFKQLWTGIWQHTHTVTTTDMSPELGELAEIIDDVSVKMIPLCYC